MFKDLDIGPVEVVRGSTSLGETKGGVRLTFNESDMKTTVDRTGETARAKYVIGTECKAVGAIAEATLAQLAEVTGMTVTEGATTDELALKDRTGTNLLDSAETVTLKPIVAGTTSTEAAKWIVIPKATIKPTFDVNHTPQDQQVWGFEIEGHPVKAADLLSGALLAGSGYAVGTILKLGDAD
jgi:hypothetical protein